MKKPEKPGNDKLSGIFRRLFAQKNARPYDHLRANPRWSAKSGAEVYTPARPAQDPYVRFRKLSTPAREAGSTPAHYIPSVEEPVETLSEPAATPVVQPAVEPEPPIEAAPKARAARKPIFEPAKTLPAFWTVASLLSLVINIILIVALILLGRELFVLKALVGNQLLGGLYENFIFMDQAHIRTNISVVDNIPISFSLPISQDTVVVLTQNTPINGANVRINTGGMIINSAANIILPAGTNLPVHLELNVPVTTTVPVKIDVPVDIPLDQTELHRPFIGLQQVVAPFYNLLQPQVKGPQDAQFCQPFSLFCSYYFQQK